MITAVSPGSPASGRTDRGFDPASISEALALLRRSGVDADRLVPEYMRLKQGTGRLIGYSIHGHGVDGEPVVLPGYVRTMSPPRARELVAKWRRMRVTPTAFGPGVRLLVDGQSVLFLFPNDAALRGLRFVGDMSKLKRILVGLPDLRAPHGIRCRRSELRLIRYKAERRCIWSASLRLPGPVRRASSRADVYLRFFSDGRGARIAETTKRLRAAAGSVAPRPLGAVLDGRLFVEERAPGVEADEALRSGTVDPAAVADVVARMHASAAELPPAPSPEQLVGRLVGGLETLVELAPALEGAVRALRARLDSALPDGGMAAPAHGDLHLHQVLVGDDGVVLIDFERAGMGAPLHDLGSLIGHLRALGATDPELQGGLTTFERGFVEAYAVRAGRVDERELAFFLGLALGERAVLALRRCEDSWVDTATMLLERALEAFPARGGRPAPPPTAFRRRAPDGFTWQVFSPRVAGPWPGFGQELSAGRAYRLYDPHQDRFVPVSPAADRTLPALRQWLQRGELVSYRPGRRATVRVQAGLSSSYVKVLTPSKARRMERRIRALRAVAASSAMGFPDLPRVAEARPNEGWIALEAIPGRSLHDLLMDDTAGVSDALGHIGAALARFHSASAATPDLPPAGPPMSLKQYLRLAAAHFPDRVSALRSALAEVGGDSGVVPPGDTLLHGDLHDRNVIIQGGRVGLLDLDAVRAGHPAEDIGNLAGHLVLRLLQRGDDSSDGAGLLDVLVHAYHRAGGTVDDQDARCCTAETLFRLACLYLFRRRWQRLTPDLLEQCVWWARTARR